MREISENQIEQILQGNSENLGLEFKPEFNFDTDIWVREKLIRSILAMSNTRDGGSILIGVVEKSDKSLNHSGINESNLSLFKSKTEVFKSKVESFSSSPVNYEIGCARYKGKGFVLISVTEFILNPLICRKNGEHKDKILEEGAIYVRALKDKPSSIKLTNPVDIQDFLERASDKQISNLHRRGWKHDTEHLKKDSTSFEKERGGF